MTYIAINTALGLLSAAAFYAVGRAVFLVTGLRGYDPWERLVLYPATGLFLYVLATFLIGLLNLYNRPVALVLLCAGLGCAVIRPGGLVRELRTIFRNFYVKLRGINDPAGFITVWVILVLGVLILARTPAPDLNWDSVSYHFGLPARYIENGGLYWVPDVRASSFPQYQEQLHVFAMLLYSDGLARFLLSFVWILLCGVTGLLGRLFFGRNAGFTGALIFAITPFILKYASIGYNEVWWPFFFVLSVYLIFRWARTGDNREILLAGAFAGLSLGSKIIQGFYLPVFLFLFFYAAYSRRIGLKATLPVVGMFFLIMLTVSAPWFVRNYVHTGDVLGYINNDYEAVALATETDLPGGLLQRFLWFMELSGFKGPVTDVFNFFVGVPLAVVSGVELWGGCEPLGWFYLAGTFLALLMTRYRAKIIALLGTVAIVYVLWVFLAKMNTPRYFVPAVPLAAVAAGAGWAVVWGTKETRIKLAIIGLFIATLFATQKGYVYVRWYFTEDYKAAFRPNSRYEHVLRTLYGGHDLPGVVADLPPGSKVLTLDDKIFYLDRGPTPVYVAYPFNDFFFDFSAAKTPEELRETFRDKGFTHVIMNRVKRYGRHDFFFPGIWCGGDPRYEQYSFNNDFLFTYGIPVPPADKGVIGDGFPKNAFGYDYLYELSDRPLRPGRPASERAGPGYDYPFEKAPGVYKKNPE